LLSVAVVQEKLATLTTASVVVVVAPVFTGMFQRRHQSPLVQEVQLLQHQEAHLPTHYCTLVEVWAQEKGR
jgi:hypothetical protein